MYGMYGYGLWIVEDKQNGRIIGRAGISIRNIDGEDCNELGYVIRREYRNKGYADEVCRAIIEYAADELEILELYIVSELDNLYSEHLALKLGFEKIAEIQDRDICLNFFYKKI